MPIIVFAVAVCMAWQDGSHNCQLARGNATYHQSEEACDWVVTRMNESRPSGNDPSIWYECYSKQMPMWQRVVK